MSRYITAETFAPSYSFAGWPPELQEFKGMLWAYVGQGVNVYDPVIILKPEMIHLADGVRVDSFVKIEGGRGVRLGRCVHIASFCHINGGGGTVEMGDYAGLASGAKVIGGTNKMDAPSMSAAAPRDMQRIEYSRTVIGPYAFLGTNAVVLPGVTVGEGAVVGAGAVVTKDVPDYEVWTGIPARKIGVRPRHSVQGGSVADMTHYLEWVGQ